MQQRAHALALELESFRQALLDAGGDAPDPAVVKIIAVPLCKLVKMTIPSTDSRSPLAPADFRRCSSEARRGGVWRGERTRSPGAPARSGPEGRGRQPHRAEGLRVQQEEPQVQLQLV